MDDLGPAMDMLPLGDLRSELTPLDQWNLASLSQREALSRFSTRDTDCLPPELEQPYERLVASLVRTWVELTLAVTPDSGRSTDADRGYVG